MDCPYWRPTVNICLEMTDLSPAVVVVLVFDLVQDRRDDEQGQETTERNHHK